MDSGELADGAVVLHLSKDEALVLFDWVHRLEREDVELKRLAFDDQAEHRVICDLSCCLERVLAEPFLPEWQSIIDEARSKVRDSSE